MAKNLKVETHREIRTKVFGVTHGNRQDVIKKRVKAGMRLSLVAEPDNPVDPLAIAVYVPAGTFKGAAQIGYLSQKLAKDVTQLLADGARLNATVLNVTGGEDGKETRGVNILVVY